MLGRSTGRRSKIRPSVVYVFARQKDRMKLFIRTIGNRAKVKVGMELSPPCGGSRKPGK